MAVVKNQEIELKIESISSEGSGVGHFDGQVIFVYNTAPGDVIKAHIIKVKKTYAVATVKEILVPSNDRIEIDCPYFKSCGGCAYRHISYDAELSIKKQNVTDAFKRIGNIDVNVEDVVHSSNIRYRNKAQIPVGQTAEGIVCGFYAARTHRIIPMTDCLLQPKEFSYIVETIRQWMNDYSIKAYDGNIGLIRHIFLRKGFKTGEIALCLVTTNDDIPNIKELISALKKYPEIVSIVNNINTEDTNVVLGNKSTTLWGKDTIDDILCGVKVSVSPMSFYQVNHDAAQLLYEKVKELCQLSGKETVVDLYCGTGTIGLSLADSCKKLVGVEIVSEAIENAKLNAKNNEITNCEFYCGDAKDLIRRFKEDNLKADIVILDPPRKGCSIGVIKDVIEMHPQKVIYVSCNVATQSRDCRIFEENSYNVEKVIPVDLFPRTAHVETVCLMSRVEGK